jgi:hypothetical protein
MHELGGEKNLLFMLGWGLLFSTSTSMLSIRKLAAQAQSEIVAGKFQRESSATYLVGSLVLVSAGSFVIWGWLELPWYLIVPEWFIGLLLSAMLKRFATPRSLVRFGCLGLILINCILWTFRTAS